MSGAERTERDSMGEVTVPADALWGAQTQRAIDNFAIGGRPMPAAFLRALARVKAAAARVNAELGQLDGVRAEAIAEAADAVAGGAHAEAFPVDVFQTGSGTSSNMNVNEVLARLAEGICGLEVSPNDHVNLGQSSNDVVPTALHVACALELRSRLLPALASLAATLRRRADALAHVTKTGRTHLMDAMPVTFGQELGAWASQVEGALERFEATAPRLRRLAIGGTAVGSGVNAHPEAGDRIAAALAAATGEPFCRDADPFRALATQETAAEVSGQLRGTAIAFTKIANDLRWMNSGPLAGLGEIELEALQPGSSIMPGKVNPVLPEAVAMAAARVIGLDATVAVAAQSGNFQLNVMLPVIADALLEMIGLLAGAGEALERTVEGFRIRGERVAAPLARNPVLVTALNPVLGYLKAAEIAKRALAEDRPILDVAEEMTAMPREELERLLDPERLTRGGIPERGA
ncbi:MAG: class II fumarate hydratase [Pseudomonadales bacterium]|jgi:fumarate hydratase class II|nr:class II fumarate hydratase [Pseudomonadales bacterium]